MNEPKLTTEQLLLAVSQLYHKDKVTLDADLRDALANGTPLAAIPNPFATVMDGIRRLEDQDAELATLRAWRARAEGVLRAFTDASFEMQIMCNDWGHCHICGSDQRHTPDCVMAQVRALLGEGG